MNSNRLISSNGASASPRGVLGSAILVALVAILVYSRSRFGGFVWDDTSFLIDNAAFRVGDWNRLIFEPFLQSGNFFRPLVLLVFVAEVRGFDADPHAMHMVSIGMHAMNSALVTLLAGMGFARGGTPARSTLVGSVILGLIYSLHPVLVEPVAWISGQFDLILIFFILLALWLDAAVSSRPLRLGLVAVSFFCAALCKEAAATFPIVLVIAHWLSLKASALSWGAKVRLLWNEHRLQYLVLIAAGCGYLALRYASFGYLLLPPGGPVENPVVRWGLPFYLYAKYLQILVWPFAGLGPLHVNPFSDQTGVPLAGLAIALAGASIVVLGLLLVRRGQTLGFALALLGIVLLPVLQIGGMSVGYSVFQERYLALPLAIMLSLTGPLLWEMGRQYVQSHQRLLVPMVSGLSLWLLVAAANVWVTVPLWRDDISLWRWALIQSPQSDYARANLLSEYIRQGQVEPALRLAKIIENDPDSSPLSLINVGSLYVSLTDVDRAEALLDSAMKKIRRGDNNSLYLLIMVRGSILDAKQQPAAAADAYRDALQVSPNDLNAHMNLALALAKAGDDRATEAAAEAERLNPPAAREGWRKRFRNTQDMANRAVPAQ